MSTSESDPDLCWFLPGILPCECAQNQPNSSMCDNTQNSHESALFLSANASVNASGLLHMSWPWRNAVWHQGIHNRTVCRMTWFSECQLTSAAHLFFRSSSQNWFWRENRMLLCHLLCDSMSRFSGTVVSEVVRHQALWHAMTLPWRETFRPFWPAEIIQLQRKKGLLRSRSAVSKSASRQH